MQGFAVRRTCRNGGICRFEAHAALCRPAYRVKHCGAVSLPAVPQCSGTGCSHGYAVRRAYCGSTAGKHCRAFRCTHIPQTIILHDEASDSDFTLSAVDFMVGAAACEMPATWPDDALLAQMVASRSYALYLSAQGQSFTANSALCSGWTSSEVLQSRWGSDYAANMQRLQSLAARTGQAVLCTTDSLPLPATMPSAAATPKPARTCGAASCLTYAAWIPPGISLPMGTK